MISKGNLLVSNLSLAEDFVFRRSVILICDNENKKNPMGFILNKPLQINLTDIHSRITKKFKVYFGGPVDQERLFCIHKSKLKLKSSKKITKDLSYGCNLNEIITKTQNGELNEENIMFFLGYSGWTDIQLLEEINERCWEIDKGNSIDIFEKSEENLWTRLTKKMKGNSHVWSNAPENLQDN